MDKNIQLRWREETTKEIPGETDGKQNTRTIDAGWDLLSRGSNKWNVIADYKPGEIEEIALELGFDKKKVNQDFNK